MGSESNQAVVANVARGWATDLAGTMEVPALTVNEVRQALGRLHEPAVHGWLHSAFIAPSGTAVETLALEMEDATVPGVDQDRASVWQFHTS